MIIKNVDENDFTFYTCESRGETKFIQLEQHSPFNGQFNDAFGSIDGIAVFKVQTKANERVQWFVGNEEITKQSFRKRFTLSLFDPFHGVWLISYKL